MSKVHEFLENACSKNLTVIVTVSIGEKTSTKFLIALTTLCGNRNSSQDWVLFRDTVNDTDTSVYRKFWVNDIKEAFYEKMTGCYYVIFKNGVLPAEIN